MNKKKAVKKDLEGKFSGTINEVVAKEDPKPSKKVKKIIRKSSKQLAEAVIADTKKAKKKSVKAEKKASKSVKKNGVLVNGSKPKPKKDKKAPVPAVEAVS